MFGFITDLTHPVTWFFLFCLFWPKLDFQPLCRSKEDYCEQISTNWANKLSKVYKWLSRIHKQRIRVWGGCDQGFKRTKVRGLVELYFRSGLCMCLTCSLFNQSNHLQCMIPMDLTVGCICLLQKCSRPTYYHDQRWRNTTKAWKMKPP